MALSKVSELFHSERSDKFSATYFWFNIANLAVTVMYVLIGWAVFKSAQPNVMDYAVYTALYAGIVTGNKIAARVIDGKFNPTTPPEEKPVK